MLLGPYSTVQFNDPLCQNRPKMKTDFRHSQVSNDIRFLPKSLLACLLCVAFPKTDARIFPMYVREPLAWRFWPLASKHRDDRPRPKPLSHRPLVFALVAMKPMDTFQMKGAFSIPSNRYFIRRSFEAIGITSTQGLSKSDFQKRFP